MPEHNPIILMSEFDAATERIHMPTFTSNCGRAVRRNRVVLAPLRIERTWRTSVNGGRSRRRRRIVVGGPH